MRQRVTTGLTAETYQFQPSDILGIPQIPSEVPAAHEVENEGEWVFPGGINPNERHETLVIVAEATVCQHFVVQSLPVTLNKQNILR